MVWLNFYRRDFLERHRLKFPSMLSEDEPFFVALLCLTDRFFCISEPLYIYTRRFGSISKDNSTTRSTKGVASLIEGCRYLDDVTSRLSNDVVSDQIKNLCMQEFIRRMIESYILRRYDMNALLSSETVGNFIQALRPLFIENDQLAARLIQACAFQTLRMAGMQGELFRASNIQRALQSELATILSSIPIDSRKIVFMNFNGQGFGCNPKYLALEILRRKLPYDLVWLVNNMNEPMPNGIRKAQVGSLTAQYCLATAKIIITNIKNSPPFSNI